MGIFFREWAPHATHLSLVGDFNQWDPNANVASPIGNGVFEVFLRDTLEG